MRMSTTDTERVLWVPVNCPCGVRMYATEQGTVSCQSRSCPEYRIEYKLPTVRLEPVQETAPTTTEPK